ncbi:MAG: 16S rRNA (guanine(966)-N(2))-methyltransferase RsmD [Syntrophobacteraceae bacterium]
MRIVAGAFRGRRLHAPKSDRIRPTSDRVREAVFSIIASEVPGAAVLDLFAGTGAMGLEALSRGAARCVFVDQGVEAVRLIRENIELCGARDSSEVVRDAVPSAIRRLAAKGGLFDLIFLDPPYGKGHVEKTLAILDAVCAPGAMAIAEHHVKDESPPELGMWTKQSERRYGDTLISIYSGS